jgi:hypothetical protein
MRQTAGYSLGREFGIELDSALAYSATEVSEQKATSHTSASGDAVERDPWVALIVGRVRANRLQERRLREEYTSGEGACQSYR